MAGEHTRGGCCGLIESNVGNLTRSDGRVKVRLKILLDKPRGSAWRPSARGVNCPVKSGKSVSDAMTQKLKLNPNICYIIGMYTAGRKEGIGVESSEDSLIERFVKISMDEFSLEPNRIRIEKAHGNITHAYFYNSRIKKFIEKTLERKEHVFKYRNGYSGAYFAGIFDCIGSVEKSGLRMRGLDLSDAMLLEKLGMHTEGYKSLRIKNQGDFITLIKGFSVKVASVAH